MSLNSFPRPEHITALIAHAGHLAGRLDDRLEVAEAGLDRFRCQYRIRILHQGTGAAVELSIHFQLAERLLASQPVEPLDRVLDEGMRRCLAAAAELSGEAD